jgi:transcriptional regulator with XRE-family HTH domain
MDKSKMAKFLVQLRNDKGLRQQDEAEIFQVSPQAISKWESGESIPDITTLEKLATFYKVSIDDIIDGETKGSSENNATIVTARNPSLEERGIGKPYYGAFIFDMSAIVVAFVIAFFPYISLVVTVGPSNVFAAFNLYLTLFNVVALPSALAWLSVLLFLSSACMSIGLWLAPSHRHTFWLWGFWLNLAHLCVSLLNAVLFTFIENEINGTSIIDIGAFIFALFAIVYFVLFVSLPITRKKTFCSKSAADTASRR